MKFCINITSGVLAGTLEDDNLRGEGRWERMVARGLVNTGEPVGTRIHKWDGDSPNWIGHFSEDGGGDFSDAVYVTIYGGLNSFPAPAFPGGLRRSDAPRAYLFQFFSGPDASIEHEVRWVMEKSGRRNVFLTHSYPSDGCFDKLSSDLQDRVALLPVPVLPSVDGDATERTVLFHPSRHTMDSLFGDGGEMLRWVRASLEADSSLTFETVSGTYVSYSAAKIWEHSLFQDNLTHLRDRVTILPPLSGAEVQAVYARTRLVVCPSGYGGPPIESARHGIPVIAIERDCSLYSAPYTPGFPELPRLGAGKTLVEILDKLLHDKDYARRVGDAGRKYVADHFGQAAFARALGGILERI